MPGVGYLLTGGAHLAVYGHRHPAKTVSFRNVLIHGYALIDEGRMCEIVTTLLPSLRSTVTALLTELVPPDA